jgi:murein DD-endopeptidase MepM/ murein hydrolase activator NlpD
MAESKKKKLITKLHHKYRLSIYNDSNLEEVWFLRLSRMNVLLVFGSLIILIIFGVTILISFTPLREFIPGYPDKNTRKTIVTNALKVDSLERELSMWQRHLDNINKVLSGRPTDVIESKPDTTKKYKNLDLNRSEEDAKLRAEVEAAERYKLSVFDKAKKPQGISGVKFYTPVRGKIVKPYNSQSGELGVLLSAAPNDLVLATLEGTVVSSGWSMDYGYTVVIQHNNNILSVYKYNSRALKKVGEKVRAGEAVAVVGAKQESKNESQLLFELWYNGVPINPQQYVIF